ncbi:MAG TPA: hypothetical protein VEL11_14675 [Candidatus Bathyarchaeia archaeon]|nr:hypothetical protein [Candidatus Bathyarchaeia archaeon]
MKDAGRRWIDEIVFSSIKRVLGDQEIRPKIIHWQITISGSESTQKTSYR